MVVENEAIFHLPSLAVWRESFFSLVMHKRSTRNFKRLVSSSSLSWQILPFITLGALQDLNVLIKNNRHHAFLEMCVAYGEPATQFETLDMAF